MSELEIYDSSDSQLSSDEYSHDEDDDALMNAAVIKQTNDVKSTQTQSSSNNTSPSKSTSTGTSTSTSTTPRKLSDDIGEQPQPRIEEQRIKAPANREQTERQNQSLQRINRAYFFYKRRSIKWLATIEKNCGGYLEKLKHTVPVKRVRALRMAQYRAAKRAIELELQLRQRRRERTPSRSPELICLDDTENEESPEKLLSKQLQPPAVQIQQQQQQQLAPHTAENGSLLDEFLNLNTANSNTAAAVAAIVEQAPTAAVSYDGPLDYATVPAARELEQQLKMVSFKAPAEEPICAALPLPLPLPFAKSPLSEVVDTPTLKRRRSVTPPAPAAGNLNEKRSKSASEMDVEVEDILELTPNQMPAAQQPAAQQQIMPQTTIPTTIATPARAIAEPSNMLSFKLGSPFSLAASSGHNDFYVQPQPSPHMPDLASLAYSLNTPTPPVVVENMDIGLHIQQQPSHAVYFNEPTPTEAKSRPAPLVVRPPPPAFATPPQPRPAKPRAEHVSRQTQTQTRPSSKSAASGADLNNSDAAFHQRVKDLYNELDEIMTDKVRAVKPELKAYSEEKQRIESDIKSLDSLISQKEDEYNRLLHLRCIKEELHARIVCKERILVMNEILPSILNKNCSTSELYEMHALLIKEQNAPTPIRYGVSAMEQLVSKLERGQDDIKIWRSALGMMEPPPPPPSALPEYDLHRRNSMPVMRVQPPPPAADRTTVYGRQGAVRDVRGLIEDYRREHPEELPLVGKRAKLQPAPPNRYQLLANSTPNLTAVGNQLPRQNSLDNHYDNESTLRPLYNSSPLVAGHQRRHEAQPQAYNDTHSIYGNSNSSSAELETARQLLQQLEDRAEPPPPPANRSNSSHLHRKRVAGGTMNGPDGGAMELERRCCHCERFEATYRCADCKNQWYCSRECQLRAWDTHWESCSN